MHRVRTGSAVAIVICLLASQAVRADVRADEKSHVEFAGALGRIVNMFGGKAAKEGISSTVAVKGDRKATIGDQTGQIIDLAEEKIYDLDMKKKSFKVTTFAQLRQRMEDAKKKAQESAQKQEAKEASQPASAPPENNIDIDFDVKDTGQKKVVNGFDTHEVVMTITLREKGKKLEDSGGMVLTSDMWLTPRIAAMKEIQDFDIRYAQKLFGPMVAGASADEVAAATAMYPLMAPALARMRTEGAKMDGTSISTVTTMDGVKSAEEVAQEAQAKQADSTSSAKTPATVSGLMGAFAKKAAAKKMASNDDASNPRSTVMTSTTEVLKVVTEVSPADVAVPAGFKENK
jgi:hypothetical protein